MEKKFYRTDEFRRLSIQWEDRLAKEGLGDIEKQLGVKQVLKQRACNAYRQMEPERREAKEIYYREISACLHQARFDSEVDEIVMTLKAQGAKITEICQELLKKGMSRYRRTVRLIIRKYEDRWGIRHWSQDQLKYNWLKRKLPTP
jgi:hypothetical protein